MFPQRKQLSREIFSFTKSAFSRGFIFRKTGERTNLILILINIIQGSYWMASFYQHSALHQKENVSQEKSPKMFLESSPDGRRLCWVSFLTNFAGCNWSLQLYQKETLTNTMLAFPNWFLIIFSEKLLFRRPMNGCLYFLLRNCKHIKSLLNLFLRCSI